MLLGLPQDPFSCPLQNRVRYHGSDEIVKCAQVLIEFFSAQAVVVCEHGPQVHRKLSAQ